MTKSKFGFDPFILWILLAALIGSVLPVVGNGVSIMRWLNYAAIALLFFMYGARLSGTETIVGLKHWRLHLVILTFTFIVFPSLGYLIQVLLGKFITPGLNTGLLFLCLVPSTVQSSITFTSIAKGNVAGAIVSASASNILGVFITPLLVMLLIDSHSQVKINSHSILDITLQLLIPFVLGQLSKKWTNTWVSNHKNQLKFLDQGVIILVVYTAFSSGSRENIWVQVKLLDILLMALVCGLLLILLLTLTYYLAGLLGFNKEDQIAIQFCGTKKSLATGMPMATVMFIGQPLGLIVLPLMIFHQAQLLVCALLASRYSRHYHTNIENL